MVWSVNEFVFRDLRRLADWFAAAPGSRVQLDRLVRRLGVTAVPLLGRQLRGCQADRRDAARDALEAIAATGAAARARVTAELQSILGGAPSAPSAASAASPGAAVLPVSDDAKVVAIGLLSELGERADTRFADPAAIRVRTAVALAAHLETPADVAGAADLMVRELDAADIVEMLEVMAGTAPHAAHRLASELALRLDAPELAKDRIGALVATLARSPSEPGSPTPGDAADPSETGEPGATVAVLVDAAARLVVIASRRLAGHRRWRRWAVLIGASGRIDDCLHEDGAGRDGDAAPLLAALCADGYRVASTELGHAREVVAAAARRTAESTRALPSPYYLGRDLLGLGDAHLGRGRGDPSAAALAYATELVAAGELDRAQRLLERCDPDNPDAAAALAASLLAQHRPGEALAALDRALAAEPDWPLHHWNRAAALHELGDPRGCYQALRRFIATSAAPSGLAADPDQRSRLACAEHMVAAFERTARLAGKPLRPRAKPGANTDRGSAST
jgi:tetratricopeptide (TPR) repeat protein